MTSQPRISPLLVLGVAILAISWGAIFVRWTTAPSTVTAFYRVLFTWLPLLPIGLWYYRTDFFAIRSRDFVFGVFAGVALALHFATWFESLEWTSVAASVTLVQSQPIFVAIGAVLLLNERVTKRMAVGILIAIAGMAAMSIGELMQTTPVGSAPGLGNTLALIGALMAAWYVLAGRSLRQRISIIPYVLIVYGACTVTLGVFVLLEGHGFTGYTESDWLLFMALAAGPGLLGHTLINWTLKYLESSVVSVSLLAEPIGATLLALVFLVEFPSPATIVGGVIVLGGIYLTAIERSRINRKIEH